MRSTSSGIGTLLIIGAALYYTGAGAWLVTQSKALGSNCYGALSNLGGASVAQPVCAGVSHAIAFTDDASGYIGRQMASLKALMGAPGSDMESAIRSFEKNISALASPEAELQRLLAQGPHGGTAPATEQFRTAIDTFKIASGYLDNRASAQLAVPWLQQGAAQPQGYGVMSQLALGQLYASGKGVNKDPALALRYLQQAQTSLSLLQQSPNPQAQQLLRTLPLEPVAMQNQIVRTIREIQLSVAKP